MLSNPIPDRPDRWEEYIASWEEQIASWEKQIATREASSPEINIYHAPVFIDPDMLKTEIKASVYTLTAFFKHRK